MRQKSYLAAVLAAALVYIVGEHAPQSMTHAFTVYVMGEGVPDRLLSASEDPKVALDCKDVAEGSPMSGREVWAGAEAAWREINRANPQDAVRKEPLFALAGRKENSEGDAANALQNVVQKDAESLVKDPSTLAVIGYPKSSETRWAAQIYSQGGIPLIMPLATSITANQPLNIAFDKITEASRLKNAFRLPPDNDAQAEAIAAFVNTSLLKNSPTAKVHLVQDMLPGNETYSHPLCVRINEFLEDRHHKDTLGRIDLDHRAEDVAEEIRNDGDRLVIFCGYYGNNGAAGHFFEALLSKAGAGWNGATATPTLIFTDGSGALKDRPNIEAESACFDGVYVADFYDSDESDKPKPSKCSSSPAPVGKNASNATPHFPAVNQVDRPELTGSQITFQAVHNLCRAQSTRALQSGYDAVLLIHEAVEKCEQSGSVSRFCVQKELEDEPIFVGANAAYAFRHGQNVFGNYFLACFGNCSLPKPRLLPQEQDSETFTAYEMGLTGLDRGQHRVLLPPDLPKPRGQN